jgi:hypothetical protein
MKKSAMATGFRTFATLVGMGVFFLLSSDLASSALSASRAQTNDSFSTGNIVYESGAEDMLQLLTYKDDPTTQFSENVDATKEYPITINRAIFDLTNKQEFGVILPELVHATVVYEKTLYHPDKSVTMVGFLKEFGQLFRTTMTLNNDVIRGKITTPDGVIRLISTPAGDLLIDQRDSYRIPGLLDDDMLLPPEPEDNIINFSLKRAVLDGNTTIDLMIVYTAGFANNHPGNLLAAKINELIAVANTAYSDSGVNITLNLVHSSQVTYSDTASNTTALNDLTNGVAGFSGVAALRSQYGADLVSLIRPYSSSHSGGCGIAWINGFQGQDISAFADNGYSVILEGEYSVGNTTYFCTDITLAHELGHNMGSAHDRAHSSDGSPGDPFDGAFSYSYGYGIDGGFGTIMSYINPEVAIFSNPALFSCNGQACGIDENSGDSANNALSLNNTREAIAGYTTSSSCPDLDADAICDASDICPADPNNDSDGDGICGDIDNCPNTSNANQSDIDNDGIGDTCDQSTDTDGDGVDDNSDNCPDTSNATQADSDSDGIGNSCDTCPEDPDNDTDGDGICGDIDNCPNTSNANQADSDNDNIGDACDAINKPGAPALNVSISGLDLSLSWARVPRATSYTLYYAPYPYEGAHTIDSANMGTAREFLVTLWPGASYFVAVTALNAGGESGYSNIEFFIISTPPPEAPTLSLSVSGLEAALSWTSVAEATGYRLYYAPNLPVGEPVYESVDMGTATEFSVTLWHGAAYSVAVTSLKTDNESERSNVELITIP